MNSSSDALRVVMYDPGAFLPYYVDHLCRALTDLGVECTLIASQPLFEPVPSDGRYQVAPLFFPSLSGARMTLVRHRRKLRRVVKGLLYPLGVWRSWLALRQGAPGVLHLQWAPLPALDVILIGALRRKGWRIVYTVHDPLPSRLRPAFLLHRRIIKMCDAVVAHTPQQAEQIATAHPDARVHVVAHGGDVHPLPTAEERKHRRQRIDVAHERPLLLFAGQLKPYKGLPDLLAAMPAVIAACPDVVLVIAGEPLMPLHEVEEQIERLGLAGHVRLRAGFVPEDRLEDYMRSADLLVATYVRGGASGMVVLAQSHGLPVLVTRVGGLPAFVEPNDSGFVVPPRSPTAVAAALVRALGDLPALREMGRRGWARLQRDNSWSDVAKRTLDVYQSPQASPRVTGRAVALSSRS